MEGVSHEAIAPGRPAEARQADRAVRRQRHHHRRRAPPSPRPATSCCASRPPAGRPRRIDGHDHGQIVRALRWAQAPGPAELHRLQDPDQQGRRAAWKATSTATATRCSTRRSPPRARRWAGPAPPFEIPDDVAKAWRKAGRRGRGAATALGGPAEGAASTAPRSSGRCAATCRTSAFAALDAHIAKARGRAAGGGHPRPLRRGAGGADPGDPGDDRRLGRPHRLQQHHRQGHDRLRRARLRRPLRPLRRARARHGRGDERHGRARRA